MGQAPAFDPNAPFEEVGGPPPFDPKAPFEPVARSAAPDEPPPFDPKAAMEPVGTPVPPGEPLKGPVPVPRARPEEAPGVVQPTQAMPPVAPLEDVPFRARSSGLPTNMLTGEQAFEERRGNIAGATAGVTEATERLRVAEERQKSMEETVPRRGTTGAQRRLAVDDEVDRAKANLTQAQAGLSAAERAAPPTETPLRSAASAAATAVGTAVPDIVGGLARPLDALYDTGTAEWMRKKSEQIALANVGDPSRQEEFATKFGSGAGSMAAFMATGVAGRALRVGSSVAAGGAGAAQEAEQFYREADQLGAPAYKKALAYVAGAAIGSTEAMGTPRILDQLDHMTGGGVKRYFGAVVKSAGEEGLQEGVQQLMENVSKYGLFGKDPGDITAGVAENALLGAMLGAKVAGVLHTPTLFRGKLDVPFPNQTTVTPADIEAQVAAGAIPGVTVPPLAGALVPGGTNVGLTAAGAIHGPIDPTQPSSYVAPTVPANVPVTTVEDGVKTTRVVHGSEEAYSVGATPEGKETLSSLQAQDPELLHATIEPMTTQARVVEPSAPVQGLYSRLAAWVAEKGPLNATAARWVSLLKRGDFTKEEMNDLGLPGFIGSGYGRVAKDDVLNYIESMSAPIMEVTREPLRPAEKEEILLGIRGQIAQVMNTHPDAVMEGPDGRRMYDPGHPLIAPLLDQHLNIEQDRRWAKYEQYTTPGPREAYSEFTMHMPGGREVDQYGAHYDTPNEVVTLRVTRRRTAEGHTVALLEEVQADLQQAGVKGLTHTESWPELGFTRFLMWAAKQGITHVAWVNSAEQMRRYPQGTEAQVAEREKGMQAFYDRKIMGIAKRWSKKLGGTFTYLTIPSNEYEVRQIPTPAGMVEWGVWEKGAEVGSRPLLVSFDRVYVEEYAQNNTVNSRFRAIILPDSAIDTIEMGMPSYAREEFPSVHMSVQPPNAVTQAIAGPLVKALDSLIRKLQINIPVTVIVHDGPITYKVKDANGVITTEVNSEALGAARSNTKRGEIHVNIRKHPNAAALWATMVHEMGHIFMDTTYATAPESVRVAVNRGYAEFRAKVASQQTTMGQVVQAQTNATALLTTTNPESELPIENITEDNQAYWRSFPEFFAEQVAKWATSRIKPLTLVDKFFKGLADKMIRYLAEASMKFGFQFEPVKALGDYLDSFIASPVAVAMGPTVSVQTEQASTIKNAAQMADEDAAAPAQAETGPATQVTNGIFNGRPPKEVQETLAYADKFNRFYKWALGIHQVAARNRHIRWLQEYVGTIQVAQQTKQEIMIAAHDVLKLWNGLGGKQADAVAQLIDHVVNMEYLTSAEVAAKVARHPTMTELTTMAQQFGVTPAGLAVYGQIMKSFDDFLTRYKAVLDSEAMKISDPVRQALKLAANVKQIAAYRSKPYFPAMRFGEYTLIVRNAKGTVIHFETFESKRIRDRAANVVKSHMAPGDVAQVGVLDKSLRPLLGVPTELLEHMASKLTLNQTQRDALEQLKFELSPAQSFKHRFQHKRRVEGYSQDFRRAYANYFFHGANHLMKVLHADRLRALIKLTKEEVADAPDVTKRGGIVKYMSNHLDSWLDPKADWAVVRSIAFLFNLAFSTAAATQNLSQTILTSYTFLAAQHGDIRGIAALVNAARKLSTFYRKGTLAANQQSSFEQKALFQGMAEGIIKETQAPELAGLADGNTLGLGFGGNIVQRSWTKFMEVGSFMFEMTEQMNRRLVFRAALELATKNPSNKHVLASLLSNKLTYDQRRAEGWTEAEAAAYTYAAHATNETQFQYGKQFAPRILKGKARSVLVFKTFMQSYLFFLWNYPQAAVRSLLILWYLTGFLGMPGADELDDILKILAYRLLGKDFDLEKEARKLIIEMVGQENGAWTADLAMHGAARKGYGIPALMDMIGGTVGVDIPMPTFDRSKALGFGTILPVELGKLFGPPLQSSEKVIAEQGQKASGAVFGLGFAAYKALFNSQYEANDMKRWESVMPRAFANVSKAYRAWNEGGSRTSTGSQIVKYDVRDPEQAAEVIGMGLGYQPYRQSYEWERALAKNDGVKFIEIRRTNLMKQFGNAAIGQDEKEMGRVREGIGKFNTDLPMEHKSMSITSDSLKKSVETRAKGRVVQEMGLSPQKSKIPVMQDIDKLYGPSQRELRKVPRGMTP